MSPDAVIGVKGGWEGATIVTGGGSCPAGVCKAGACWAAAIVDLGRWAGQSANCGSRIGRIGLDTCERVGWTGVHIMRWPLKDVVLAKDFLQMLQ